MQRTAYMYVNASGKSPTTRDHRCTGDQSALVEASAHANIVAMAPDSVSHNVMSARRGISAHRCCFDVVHEAGILGPIAPARGQQSAAHTLRKSMQFSYYCIQAKS
jgi:hypothetical protein